MGSLRPRALSAVLALALPSVASAGQPAPAEEAQPKEEAPANEKKEPEILPKEAESQAGQDEKWKTPPPAGANQRAAFVYPKLTLAGHFAVGPHSAGQEACELRGGQTVCDRTGRYFGVGGNIDVRVRLWKFVYFNGRAQVTGNGRRVDGLYAGVAMPAVGLGLYTRQAFLRAEYMLPFAFGTNEYRVAGSSDAIATEKWGNHAGGLTAGLAVRLGNPRVRAELTGGFMIGPSVERIQEEAFDNPQRPFLLSFHAGIGLAFDVVE